MKIVIENKKSKWYLVNKLLPSHSYIEKLLPTKSLNEDKFWENSRKFNPPNVIFDQKDGV